MRIKDIFKNEEPSYSWEENEKLENLNRIVQTNCQQSHAFYFVVSLIPNYFKEVQFVQAFHTDSFIRFHLPG